MAGTDVRRIWYRRVPGAWYYAFPLGLAAYAVAQRSWLAACWALLTFPQVWLARRGATTLTAEGIETGVLRRRRVPWGEVRALRASSADPRAAAVLADGTAVPLRAVEWYAPRPEGRAPRGSVQAVAEWARAHGHDVPVVA
ncbi:MAG TPA: PH domain-containing protein [Frankiaceae bacterium]|jgi:hypothetical protein|nr:PH domain-containing protein [Frankiaceae bacterium]